MVLHLQECGQGVGQQLQEVVDPDDAVAVEVGVVEGRLARVEVAIEDGCESGLIRHGADGLPEFVERRDRQRAAVQHDLRHELAWDKATTGATAWEELIQGTGLHADRSLKPAVSVSLKFRDGPSSSRRADGRHRGYARANQHRTTPFRNRTGQAMRPGLHPPGCKAPHRAARLAGPRIPHLEGRSDNPWCKAPCHPRRGSGGVD